jgi:hypothetical protein
MENNERVSLILLAVIFLSLLLIAIFSKLKIGRFASIANGVQAFLFIIIVISFVAVLIINVYYDWVYGSKSIIIDKTSGNDPKIFIKAGNGKYSVPT